MINLQEIADFYLSNNHKKNKKIIHVNMHHIKHNTKYGTNLPIFTIKMNNQTLYAWTVIKCGISCLEAHFADSLSCGARAYDTTYDELILLDENNKVFNGITFTEVKKMFGDILQDTIL